MKRIDRDMTIQPRPHDLADAVQLPEPQAVITFERVSRTFPAVGNSTPITALDAVSFDVARGEVFGIIGRSGAGKSTLIDLRPDCHPVRGRVLG